MGVTTCSCAYCGKHLDLLHDHVWVKSKGHCCIDCLKDAEPDEEED